MKYDHNQICTKGNEIVDGEHYDFKEESLVLPVEVISQEPTESWISFTLKEIGQNGEPFVVGAATGHYAYNGMWRLWDKGTYT